MAPDCHRLLKASCVIMGVSLSEFCLECISERFQELCEQDDRFLTLLLSSSYPEGTPAYLLKEKLKDHTID